MLNPIIFYHETAGIVRYSRSLNENTTMLLLARFFICTDLIGRLLQPHTLTLAYVSTYKL